MLEHKTIDLENILSSHKVTRRDDSSLLLEGSDYTASLLGILLFCLASITYGFITLDTRSAILLSSFFLLILGLVLVVVAFGSPVSIYIRKGSITLKYLKIFGVQNVITYDLSMIKGIYPKPYSTKGNIYIEIGLRKIKAKLKGIIPEPYSTRHGSYNASVCILLNNDKSVTIFNHSCSEEAAISISGLISKYFSDLLGTQIVIKQ
jgi:hypothetical protein